jgi:hypothetical protein
MAAPAADCLIWVKSTPAVEFDRKNRIARL